MTPHTDLDMALKGKDNDNDAADVDKMSILRAEEAWFGW